MANAKIYYEGGAVVINDGSRNSTTIGASDFYFTSDSASGTISLFNKSTGHKYATNSSFVVNKSGVAVGTFRDVVSYLSSMYKVTQQEMNNPIMSMSDLTDVNLSSLASGDSLKFDGNNWVNEPIKYFLDLTSETTLTFPAFANMRIISYEAVTGSPTVTIKDDAVAYTLGDLILAGSTVEVTVTVNCPLILTINEE